MKNAGYNSPVPHMPSSWPRCLRLLCALLVLSAGGFASDWSGPIRQLTQKIAAITGPGAVSLQVMNRSSLSQADVESIRVALGEQLNANGTRLVNPEQASANVQVGLSENLQNYVWVATIQQGTESKTEIVSVPRVDAPPPIHEPVQLTIRKILAWSQEEPILDVAVVDTSPPQVVVLDPGKIAIYGLRGQWQLQQSFPVAHSRPWPRDLRGRILLRNDHLFDAYLPGVVCGSTAAPPLAVTCRDTDDPWPLGSAPMGLTAFFSPTRNFFTGALTPGVGKERTVPPFYSAAPVPREKYVLWLFAGVDGQVHEVDGMNEPMLARPSWGSEIAALKTNCGSGWQILATSNGDSTIADAVRAYEFPDRDPVPVSAPMETNGTVTALWTESRGSGVMAIWRNRQAGKYEAYRLEIACGQ